MKTALAFVVCVLPLAAATAFALVHLPWWATLGPAVVLVATLLARAQPRPRARVVPATPVPIRILAACFALVSCTGLQVWAQLTVAHLASIGMLLVLIARRRPPGPDSSRIGVTVAIAAGLLVVGSATATWWNSSAASLLKSVELVVVAAPVVLALRHCAPTRHEARLLVKWWVVGVLVSAIAGLAFLRFPSGRAAGFTAHPNQLAMSCVIAIPLVWGLYVERALSRNQAVVATAVLTVAIFGSGARSGLLAAGVVSLVVLYRAIGVFRTAVLSAVGGLALYVLTTRTALGSADNSALSRLLDPSATESSDQKRLRLMARGLDRLGSVDTRLFGSGWVREDQPHNLVILVWGAAGLLGVVALVLLLWRITLTVSRVRAPALEWSLAVSALGFLMAAFVNNALLAPFAWAVLALLDHRWPSSEPRLTTEAGPSAATATSGARQSH